MYVRFLIEKRLVFLASVHNLQTNKGKVVKKSKITEELVNKSWWLVKGDISDNNFNNCFISAMICCVAKKFLLNVRSLMFSKSYVIFLVSLYCNVLTYHSFPVNFRVDSLQIFAILTKLTAFFLKVFIHRCSTILVLTVFLLYFLQN